MLSSQIYHKSSNQTLKSQSRTDLGKGDFNHLGYQTNRFHSFEDQMDIDNLEDTLESDPFEVDELGDVSFSINEPTTLASTSISSIPIAISEFESNRESPRSQGDMDVEEIETNQDEFQNLPQTSQPVSNPCII